MIFTGFEIVAVCYLLGSIPFGYIVGKAHGIDIREHGSKNIGATNVIRVLGKKVGIPVFIGDILKGIVAVENARLLVLVGLCSRPKTKHPDLCRSGCLLV